MNTTLRKRLEQATATLVAVAVVLSVLGPIGAVAAAPGVSVGQTADSATVAPGGTVTFTATVSVTDLNGMTLDAQLPDGWTVTNESSGGTYAARLTDWVWLSATEDTVTYTVQVPEDAAEGDYTVSVTGAGTDPGTDDYVTQTTDTTVTVQSVNERPTASITGPTSAQVGETVNFTATASDDGSIESYEWDFGGDGSAAGASVSHAFSAAGDYAVELTVTDDQGATATATQTVTVVEPAPDSGDAAGVNVSFVPTGVTVTPGETAAFDVVVDSDDVGAVDLTVSVADGGVATIESVDTPASTASEDISNDGQTATIEAYGLQSAAQGGSTTVATVIVAGASVGTTALSLDAVGVSDVQGSVYDVTAGGDATLTVAFPALSDELAPPTNLDGDAVLEDVNGDGAFDAGDATALFANRDAALVQNNPAQFDFNGDGSVDVFDVQAAFYEAVLDGAN